MQPMRLNKRQVTDRGAIRSIIDAAQVLRVGTVDDKGMFIVPMSYGYEWRDSAAFPTFYLHSAREGRKARAWSANNGQGVIVAAELDIDRGNIVGAYSCAYSRSYQSVMATGTVCPVESDGERLHALQLLMAHAAPNEEIPVFEPVALARVGIFRIDIAELSAKERAPKA